MTIDERNDLLTEIYNLHLIDNYCKKIAYDDEVQLDDIIQEIYLQVCEVSTDKWEELLSQGTKNDRLKAVRAFVSGICYLSIRSKNSRVYYKLKKHTNMEYTKSDDEWETLSSQLVDNTLMDMMNGRY